MITGTFVLATDLNWETVGADCEAASKQGATHSAVTRSGKFAVSMRPVSPELHLRTNQSEDRSEDLLWLANHLTRLREN